VQPPLRPDLPGGERLQKVLAARGFGSRRTCEDLIVAGRVTVNGEIAVLGRRVDEAIDVVAVDGVPVGIRPGLVYWLLNKPRGAICSAADEHGRSTVYGLVPPSPRVHTVGRLDADSEGLLLLTNDGDLTAWLTHPRHEVEKEYLAVVSAPRSGVPRAAIRALREGVELDDGITLPAEVSQPQPGVLRIVLREGRNRQVRRMCDRVGHPVTRLVRTRIGSLIDASLAPGSWRDLTIEELRSFGQRTGGRRYAQRS
jgi:23S rRNA pseudouridine2605 synthase